MNKYFSVITLGILCFFSASSFCSLSYKEIIKEDDFSACQKLYLKLYTPMSVLSTEGLEKRFALLKGLIGQGIQMLGFYLNEQLIGFATVERVSATRVALYESPIEFSEAMYSYLFTALQEQFPTAQEVVCVANKNAPKIIAYAKSFGFEPCDDFIPNKFIIPNPEQYQAFKKIL